MDLVMRWDILGLERNNVDLDQAMDLVMLLNISDARPRLDWHNVDLDPDLVTDLGGSPVIREGDLCGISMFLDWIDWNRIGFYGTRILLERIIYEPRAPSTLQPLSKLLITCQ
jgi:hypothetical protein